MENDKGIKFENGQSQEIVWNINTNEKSSPSSTAAVCYQFDNDEPIKFAELEANNEFNLVLTQLMTAKESNDIAEEVRGIKFEDKVTGKSFQLFVKDLRSIPEPAVTLIKS